MNSVPLPSVHIRRLLSLDETQILGLSEVLVDCVDGGASVSFMQPFSIAQAQAFWRQVAEGLARQERALLVAQDAQGIVGTVQLLLAQPDNQPHRADLAKMLVHRRGRRRGIATALMNAVEDLARDCGKSLLVLDTVTGGDAERLYTRQGWTRVGDIPGYALWPQGGLCGTSYFYKNLGMAG